MNFKDVKLTCTILSPVHVGTGEEIAAYDYFIQSGLLIKVNMNKVINSLTVEEIDYFNTLNDEGNYLAIRKFLAQKSHDKNWLSNVTDFTVPVSKEVENKYIENINSPENQLLINLNQRTSILSEPVLPGSSIKGAIRTAILSKLAQEIEYLPNSPQKAEGKILNALDKKTGKFKVQWDPFKYLKVDDVRFEKNTTYICFIKNVAKGIDNSIKINNMQMIHEVLNSFLSGNELNFELVIRLAKMRVKNVIIDKKFITDACNLFYFDKLMNSEFNFFQGTDVEENILKIKEQVNLNDEFLIRVGRFSGKESITLDKHRKGALPQTRNLADGKYPMGWIKCRMYQI